MLLSSFSIKHGLLSSNKYHFLFANLTAYVISNLFIKQRTNMDILTLIDGYKLIIANNF